MAFQQSESGRSEQIISQFFIKTLQSILAARIPHLALPPDQASAGAGGVRARRRDRCFNLALGELPPVVESSGFWNHGVVEPMILDVILYPREGCEPGAIVERWTVQCESPLPLAATKLFPGGRAGGVGSSSSLCRRTYKKCILLLRCIYSLLRYLPAYRVFRLLSCSNLPYNYEISFRVSSFTEHFSREEEKGFELQGFTPVETQFGHLSVSVLYRPTLSDFNLEVSSLLPPVIISDYVGSPAAEPMKAFPASPSESGTLPVSSPQRGLHLATDPGFQRQHSLVCVPMAHHLLNTSPNEVMEHRASPPEYFSVKKLTVPRQCVYQKGSFSLDEFNPSHTCSQSRSPSPPAHTANTVQTRFQWETAPVSIPQPLVVKNQLLQTPNLSDPTRSLLPPPSPRRIRADDCSEESYSGSRSFRKLEALKMVDLHSQMYTVSKAVKDAKDESGQFSGVLCSIASPRFFFSRSSSRKVVQDDHEDCEFSCPFAVDDVDMSESPSRNHDGTEASESASTNTSPRGSQDAAVGALVHMLRTAAPLRHDHSYPSQSCKPENNPEICKPNFFISQKKSDALEELRRYREIKEILLSKSRSELLDSIKTE